MRDFRYILFLIFLINISCIRNQNYNEEKVDPLAEKTKVNESRKMILSDCYNTSVNWHFNDSIFKDTSISVRNYQKDDSRKRIICNNFIDLECEKLAFENKHMATYIKSLERLNKSIILSYFKIADSKIIAQFYLSDNDDLRTFKLRSFLIENNTIVGINIFPEFLDEFISIEEFESKKNIDY